MITYAILHMLLAILTAVLGLLPALPSPPSWITQNTAISTVFQDANSMGVWFPTTLALTVLGAIAAVWLTGFGIKAARIVVSLFTGGGGGAA